MISLNLTMINIFIKLFLETSSTYVQRSKTYCRGKYAQYPTIEEAQVACSSDTNCVAVYDQRCDGKDFTLCPKKDFFLKSSSSCIYEKTITGEIVYSISSTVRMLEICLNIWFV